MRTINYKGFELDVEVNGNELLINNVEASITNQVALLTECLWNSTQDDNKVEDFTVELDYKVVDWHSDYGCDLGINIDKWYSTDVRERDRLLIELLMLEENEIMEQLQELV